MYMNFDVHTFKIQIVLKCKFKKNDVCVFKSSVI